MSEFDTRFAAIRKIVTQAKAAGLDRRERREAVIDIESALEKKVIKKRDGIDFRKIVSLGKKDITQEPPEVKDRAIKKYFKLVIPPVYPPVVVESLHGQTETKIDEIGRRASNRLNSPLMIAKKDRKGAEGNQDWWKGNGNKERSRSIRAARFWAVERILKEGNLLNQDGKLKQRFYQLSLHGMVDDNGFDVAIATGHQPADKDSLERFRNLVQSKMGGYKVELIGGDHKLALRYSGYPSLANFRREPPEEKDRQHPAFGYKFKTFQVEISRRFRVNRDRRKMITNALVYAMKEIQND